MKKCVLTKTDDEGHLVNMNDVSNSFNNIENKIILIFSGFIALI